MYLKIFYRIKNYWKKSLFFINYLTNILFCYKVLTLNGVVCIIGKKEIMTFNITVNGVYNSTNDNYNGLLCPQLLLFAFIEKKNERIIK